MRIDYPDKAREVGEAIQRGDAERAVLVCGSGVGAAVAACKLTGIRAAICHDTYSAHQGVEHDDMNVLCLGSEVVGPSLARELVDAFLERDLQRRGALRGAPAEGRRDGKGDERWQSHRCMSSTARGQSVWFDTLSRELIESGGLKRMMDADAVTGVTSNPTIFQKALVGGRRLRRAAEGAARDRRTTRRRSSSRSRSRTSATPATCCGRPSTRRTANDGYVSMEVEPGHRLRHREDVRPGALDREGGRPRRT